MKIEGMKMFVSLSLNCTYAKDSTTRVPAAY